MKQWRSQTNRHLFKRPIYKDEWPKLILAMKEDGLIAVITSTGLDWFNNGYSLTASQSVKRGCCLIPNIEGFVIMFILMTPLYI